MSSGEVARSVVAIIRTPISAITSMTAFAREDVEDKARLNEDLDKIEASSAFLLSLINDCILAQNPPGFPRSLGKVMIS